MPEPRWEEIRRRLDSHAHMSGVERDATRIEETAEVFTPTELVLQMLQGIDLTSLAPGRTVLDPACGDGQFLVAIKWVKVLFFEMKEEDALADIYGVDIMRDNVDICRRRLGGGTIVMGDALSPETRLPGQTDHEHLLMMDLFARG